jgi:hypothetical protein
MRIRQLCASVVGIGLLWAASAGPAHAQGQVFWVQNYPDTSVAGQVKVYGSYTVNQGWIASAANFAWTPLPSGTPQGISLDFLNGAQNGFIGHLDQATMQIVPKVHNLPAGKYQGWLTVWYDTHPPQKAGPTVILSTVLQFTVQ